MCLVRTQKPSLYACVTVPKKACYFCWFCTNLRRFWSLFASRADVGDSSIGVSGFSDVWASIYLSKLTKFVWKLRIMLNCFVICKRYETAWSDGEMDAFSDGWRSVRRCECGKKCLAKHMRFILFHPFIHPNVFWNDKKYIAMNIICFSASYIHRP